MPFVVAAAAAAVGDFAAGNANALQMWTPLQILRTEHRVADGSDARPHDVDRADSAAAPVASSGSFVAASISGQHS